MKKLLLSLAVVFLAAGCENNAPHKPTAASSATAPAHPTPTPRPSPAGSPGTGAKTTNAAN